MNDLISRQSAIDALDVLCQEHRYKIPGKGETYSQYNEAWQDALDRAEGAIGNLPSAQPDLQEYSVWFRIGETLVDVSKMHITAEEGIEKIRSYLMRMKKPERKKGKWIAEQNCYYRCSECGAHYPSIGKYMNYNFCPDCGVDMRGDENARWRAKNDKTRSSTDD